MASAVLLAKRLNCGNLAELTAFEYQALLGKHIENLLIYYRHVIISISFVTYNKCRNTFNA